MRNEHFLIAVFYSQQEYKVNVPWQIKHKKLITDFPINQSKSEQTFLKDSEKLYHAQTTYLKLHLQKWQLKNK